MVEEKIITVNLRKKLIEYPRWKRANKAVKILKEVLRKNIKSEIKIDRKLNEKIWKNIPAKLRIKIVKVDDKSYKAELME